MKTNLLFALFASALATGMFAQDRTTVTATSNDISDNLDLRAVASIFGDSENLEDFERRLNDPKMQISNLDLNGDNRVDYLRVIESVEGNTHLIIIQSVLQRDVFQDVATVEVERDRNNQVQVQVVGDVYMYGQNYIYEPVYVYRPVIYDYFWVTNYHPYHSMWYWDSYPTYYYAWTPCASHYYANHVNGYINVHNHYNYVNIRRSHRAVALHNHYRANGYETQYPTRSFAYRNENVRNRYELDQVRNSGTRNTFASNSGQNVSHSNIRNTSGTQNGGIRSDSYGNSQASQTPANNGVQDNVRNYSGPRPTSQPRPYTSNGATSEPNSGIRSATQETPTPRPQPTVGTRNETNSHPRNEVTSPRSETAGIREYTPVRTSANTRDFSNTRAEAPVYNTNTQPRENTRYESSGGGRQSGDQRQSASPSVPQRGGDRQSAASGGTRSGRR